MIPIIAVSDLDDRRPDAVERLRSSLREYTVVHVDARAELGPQFFAGLYEQTQQFFGLPAAEKQSLDINRSRNYRGYVGQGAEYTNGIADLKESFEFGKEIPAPSGEPQPWFDLYGENQWPDDRRLPRFRPVVTAYTGAMARIARAVLKALMATLGQPAEGGMADGELCLFSRLIYYSHPSQFASQQTRLGRHTDSGMITIGLQNAPGLEVESPAHGWVEVRPPEDVFTVFPGELAEIWAHGYYRACAHRVHNSALRTERLSYASFVLPDLRRGLTPVDPASSQPLSAAGPAVSRGNSWLAGGRAFAADVPIGALEWERMSLIFPHREATAG